MKMEGGADEISSFQGGWENSQRQCWALTWDSLSPPLLLLKETRDLAALGGGAPGQVPRRVGRTPPYTPGH